MVLLSFTLSVVYFRAGVIFRVLFFILLTSFLTEAAAIIILRSGGGLALLYTVSIIIHNCLWLYMLRVALPGSKGWGIILGAYILFCFFNLAFLEGFGSFNHYTLISGAFLYVVLFSFYSLKTLLAEDDAFFNKKEYILLFAPVLLFLGMSFVFGFKSERLADTKVFATVGLYDIVISFVNLIYYLAIITYILKTRKVQNAE